MSLCNSLYKNVSLIIAEMLINCSLFYNFERYEFNKSKVLYQGYKEQRQTEKLKFCLMAKKIHHEVPPKGKRLIFSHYSKTELYIVNKYIF